MGLLKAMNNPGKKIIIGIGAGVCVVLILFFGLYFFEKANSGQFASLLSYLSENAHTGLVNTPGQLAFEEQSAKQFAQVQPESSGQASLSEGAQKIAMGEKPIQLFDISLELDQSSVSKIEDLDARVIFSSFGTVPTPVQMTFKIVNSEGQTMYSEVASAVVETEMVYNKKFNDLNLPSGKYTLQLTTLYNQNVEDSFSQPFNITTSFDLSGVSIEVWIVLAFFVFTLSVNAVKYIKALPKHDKV